MKLFYIRTQSRIFQYLFSWSLLIGLMVVSTWSVAQQNNLPCNIDGSTPFIPPTFGSFSVNTSANGGIGVAYWENNSPCSFGLPLGCGSLNIAANVINSTTTDFASVHLTGIGATASLTVTEGTNTYSGGNFAGFVIKNSALIGGSLLGAITISTYNNGSFVEASTSSSLLGVNSSLVSGAYEVGFITKQPFDAIQITFGGLASAQVYDVYYAVMRRFCTGPTLACNVKTPVVTTSNPASTTGFPVAIEPSHTGVSGVSTYTIVNAKNIIDSDLTNSASISSPTIVNVSGVSSVSIAIKDQVTDYPATTFAGFDIQSNVLAGLGVLNRIVIKTYLDGTLRQTVPGSSLLVSAPILSSSGRQTIGFVASLSFDEVQLILETPANLSIGTTQIYSAIFRTFCEGTTLACNTSTLLNESTQPVLIDITNTGTSGAVCVNCTVSDAQNAIDGNATTAASISLAAGAGTTASLAVKKVLTNYPVNTFAGFDIENPVLIGANVLSGITIQTLLDGNPVQTVNSTNGLVSLNSSVLSGTGRQTVGFVASSEFNGIKITLTNGASLDLGQTKIYSAIVKKFCTAANPVCGTMTNLKNPTYPVYVNSKNTGVGSVACAGCTINNSENVIDGATTSPATIVLGAGVASSATFSVANAIDTYPAETFAGFDIESSTLLGVNLAGSTTITLYNNGTAVQSGTGTALLAGATLLSGNRQVIGTVAQVPFDEIKIEFNQLGSANLGTISIYQAVIQTSCVTAVACNQTRYLSAPTFSAVVEGTRTGFSGAATAGDNYIQDPWNVVTASTTDFARIANIAGGAVTASISVADPANVYPAGTFAGYTINKGAFVVSADLFSRFTVRTYLNGVLQESRSGGNLLDLTVFLQLFGTPSNFYNVGFVTTKPFDEIQLSVGSLVGALAQFVDVYGAFVDTRTSSNGGSLVCNFVLNPDFNVTTKKIPVSGNVSTNDIVPAGTTYGTPTASSGNPTGATITLNSNGVYSFTATNPGSYTYSVPVCATGQTTCPVTPLIITVLDVVSTTNIPVANPDYASVQSSTAAAGSVTVNVRANDGPGNTGGTLNIPTIISAPTHGSATVDGTGNVIYTPATGYIGDDVLTYQVCETPGGLCSSAQVTIHVTAPGSSTVTVVDDYAKTRSGVAVTGNLLTNDQGSGLTVSNAGTIVSSLGTLVISSTGSFSFTPVSTVTGPVDFTYTACDNSTTAVCGTATLHVLVTPAPDLTPIIYARPSTVYGTTNISVVVDVYELNSISTNGTVTVKLTRDPKLALSFPGTANSVGGRAVNNGVWSFDDTSDEDYYILTTNQSIAAGNVLSFGLTGTLTPGATTGTIVLTAVVEADSGGQVNLINNTDADRIQYFQQ
ncbi:Ig-like domain-containing protein [Spirosoma sp. KNUC1025]|uniref:beta strand repeat-containing protein n=1 Tax=Spirosoma sp. KNUC1025 TaxID=2894082 RepID=UPI00386B43A1|nr:Ig-like domain-containing protein [Spirosoma sp. KNUC1025]